MEEAVTNGPRPTGTCWCGCGEEVGLRSFFLPGHDRKAEAALIRLEYGSVAQLLEEHGYGPSGKNLTKSLRDRELG